MDFCTLLERRIIPEFKAERDSKKLTGLRAETLNLLTASGCHHLKSVLGV